MKIYVTASCIHDYIFSLQFFFTTYNVNKIIVKKIKIFIIIIFFK